MAPGRRTLLRGGALAFATLAAPAIARGAGALTLRLAHAVGTNHPAQVAATQFAIRVSERTEGAVSVTILSGSEAGDAAGQAQQVKAGTLDMALPTQMQLELYERCFAAVTLPFLFDTRAQIFRVLDGPATAWLAPLAAAQGFVLLRHWDGGFRHVTNDRRPIFVPDDMKGMRIRTPASVALAAAMQACGATSVPLASAELRRALTQNLVDGAEHPLAVIESDRLAEVQSQLALTSHAYACMIHVISTAAWSRLTAAQQAVFRDESAAAAATMRTLIGDGEVDRIARLRGAGMTVTSPDLRPFRIRMAPAYDKVSAMAGADNVALFRAMVEHART